MTLAITTLELASLATAFRVRVVEHQGGPKGRYMHQTRTISMRAGLSERAYRSTLAHELGHAFYGDELTGIEYIDGRAEQRADQFACNLLIDTRQYKEAELLHGPHEDAIAHDLGVTRHLLRAWRGLLERSRTT